MWTIVWELRSHRDKNLPTPVHGIDSTPNNRFEDEDDEEEVVRWFIGFGGRTRSSSESLSYNRDTRCRFWNADWNTD